MWKTDCGLPFLNFFAWTSCRTINSFLSGFFAIFATLAVNLGLTSSAATFHLFGFCLAETDAVISCPLWQRAARRFGHLALLVIAAAFPAHSGLKRGAHLRRRYKNDPSRSAVSKSGGTGGPT